MMSQMLRCLKLIVIFPFLSCCTGLEFYSFNGTNHQPVEPLVREQPEQSQGLLQEPPQEEPRIQVTLDATAHMDRLPFEVDWSARVSGGDPPYEVDSPSGPRSLSEPGGVDGKVFFYSNKDPWKLRITVKDASANEGAAGVIVENTILAGSVIALDGRRLAPGSKKLTWEQVHSPDRYRGWEYVTGNEAEISDPSSPVTTGNRWMVVPYMRRYEKSLLVIAYAIPNGDGVNRYVHLHGERPEEGPLRIDNQESVDYLEAEFRALAQLAESDVWDRFLGAVVWELKDFKVPEARVDWGVADRPVEKVIPLWFSGKR